MLRLDHVTKSYAVGKPNAIEVLHDISLTLHAGEFVALIGPSGSGKSTLLNIIGLLDRPTSGRLWLHGADTGTLDDAALTTLRNEQIGFVFQQSYLLSAFTAIENVMMPMLLKHEFPTAAMRAHAATLLETMGLAAWADHPSVNLSGGQKQRVAIARALAMDPTLILADEPTGNLDSRAADNVFALMRTVNQERRTTFLIVTHNEALAARCDRIVEVVDGRLTAAVA
ncbi:MAG: ABC transporter ATP-binding protein [Gemmatimonadaceae bacterium]|nr:ABC transporter ATP-binding protein [Gemmatimonadaceae bacterium]